MPLKIETITRVFNYNGVKLPDPNPSLDINAVREIFTTSHPEIANAAIDGPKVKDNVHTYTFVRSVGEKG